MKNIKYFLAIISIVLISWLNIKFPNSRILMVVGAFLTVVLIFNFSIRKRIQFKSYFLNPWNFLVSTQFSNQNTEISAGLMYEKMLEVVQTQTIEYEIQTH
jgi:hypothetical protein